MSNSNFEITNFTIDAISQKISSVEINGEVLETGGSVTVEDNKAATINVSTYTNPVEITPTSGNDAMAKATVTLSNIPSGVSTFYAWLDGGSSRIIYTKTATPSVNDTIFAPFVDDGTNIISNDFIVLTVNEDIITYGRSGGGGGEAPSAMRYADGDITL